MPRRTAPEIIGQHLGVDPAEVRAGRYQSSRYAMPAVYVFDGEFFCSPSGPSKCPKGFAWTEAGRYDGRVVYSSKGS